MANKMLIDAAHPEETRVVVLRGNRVEDFDFESASKKPLRGNIYLAKVTRVEPSLQAAFIEYGGNRHGFLAFSEIHPDYYQIPVADRQALLEEEARAHREEDEEPRQSGPRRSRRRRHGGNGRGRGEADEASPTVESEHEEALEADSEAEASAPEDELEADAGSAAAHDDIEAAERSRTEAAVTEEPALPGFEDGTSADTHEVEAAEAPSDLDPPQSEGPSRGPAQPAAIYEPPGDRIVGAIEPVIEGEDQDGHPLVVAEIVEDSASPVEHADFADPTDPAEAPDGGEDEGGHDDEATDENAGAEQRPIEQLGGDALEDVPVRTPRLRRHYKIQEVIKRRQILLVQVVKEERGNKGAALTTYLSLAGRYSVLMPNTARGGGISRKITDAEDRKRLKAIASELDVPEGMGIILRTAGAARGEGEVKRDFEYLLRMWETVRELTLRSTAPMLVYEEGSLIKRAIRDLYSKEIDEIQVAGEEGYKEARDFMRLLMPTHVRNVVPYRDSQPIFAKAGAEAQLDAMFSNHVTLKSGGYLVINQTEALVAIDVNSGRSTREHNIEDTALRTNLEAADEVARQLRLRDLAGLIVVDFIDMEESRNNRAVERRLKDALKNDRARIQIGHISHFGLLEMSRQRIRTGVLEGSTVLCPHCAGAGTVRSTSSIALHVLRVLEDHLIRNASFNLIVRTRMEVALYILNQKRTHLNELESRFGAGVTVMADASLTGTIYHAIERGEPATPLVPTKVKPPALGTGEMGEEVEAEDLVDGDEEDNGEDAVEETASRSSEDETGGRRRRRRRRRGRDRDTRGPASLEEGEQPSDSGMAVMAVAGGDLAEAGSEPAADRGDDPAAVNEDGPDEAEAVAAVAAEAVDLDTVDDEAKEAEAPRRRRSRRAAPRAETVERTGSEEAPPRRSRRSRSRAAEDAPSLALDMPAEPTADRDLEANPAQSHPAEAAAEPVSLIASEQPAGDVAVEAIPEPAEVAQTPAEPPRPKRSGWWQRAKATITGE